MKGVVLLNYTASLETMLGRERGFKKTELLKSLRRSKRLCGGSAEIFVPNNLNSRIKMWVVKKGDQRRIWEVIPIYTSGTSFVTFPREPLISCSKRTQILKLFAPFCATFRWSSFEFICSLLNRDFNRQFFPQKFWVKSESTPVILSKNLS